MPDCKAYRLEIEEAASLEGLGREARAHVEACRACRDFQSDRAALRHLVGGLERVAAPEDFEFRLRARLHAARMPERGNRFFRLGFAPGLAWVAAATCFVLVSTFLYLRQEQPKRPFEAQQAGVQSVAPREVASAVASDSALMSELKEDSTLQKVSSVKTGVNVTRGVSRQPAREVAGRLSGRDVAGSAVFDERVANVINPRDVVAGAQRESRGAMLAIPLRTSSETLRVVLRDERGEAHPLPMRAVSFGSQELVARENPRTRVVAATDRDGVW
jgi:hypothetical protein